jgi:lipoyl(octanoyl) transferase
MTTLFAGISLTRAHGAPYNAIVFLFFSVPLCLCASVSLWYKFVNMNIKNLGLVDYAATYQAMQDFNAQRDDTTPDEIWLLQHPPTFTLGLAAKAEHILDAGKIPIIKIDRGGQVTYHGPGQLVVYLLLDLKRRNIGVRELVRILEQAIIDTLADYNVVSQRIAGAPGIYIDGAKIAALGLRVKRGCCYHGLAINIDMDLAPFSRINPCGYAGMPVTQTKDLGVRANMNEIGEKLISHLHL